MRWLHRHITQHEWDMKWFGPRSLYYKVLFTWGQWVMPSVAIALVWEHPPLIHLVILAVLSLAAPSHIVKRRASELWEQDNHERWLRKQEIERKERVAHDMRLFGDVRANVAIGNYTKARSFVGIMRGSYIEEQAYQYMMDHWTRSDSLLWYCHNCGEPTDKPHVGCGERWDHMDGWCPGCVVFEMVHK